MLLEATRAYRPLPEGAVLLTASEPMKMTGRDDRPNSQDSCQAVASSPTDSVSSLHDALSQDYRQVSPRLKIQKHSFLLNIALSCVSISRCHLVQ